jgi:hypothetical protein
MKYIIKSIEGPISECMDENNELHYILCRDLPDKVKEGDCLYEDDQGRIRIDELNTRINKKASIQVK